jgi:hypothetical protein
MLCNAYEAGDHGAYHRPKPRLKNLTLDNGLNSSGATTAKILPSNDLVCPAVPNSVYETKSVSGLLSSVPLVCSASQCQQTAFRCLQPTQCNDLLSLNMLLIAILAKQVLWDFAARVTYASAFYISKRRWTSIGTSIGRKIVV